MLADVSDVLDQVLLAADAGPGQVFPAPGQPTTSNQWFLAATCRREYMSANCRSPPAVLPDIDLHTVR
jgi:hypothetical protein